METRKDNSRRDAVMTDIDAWYPTTICREKLKKSWTTNGFVVCCSPASATTTDVPA